MGSLYQRVFHSPVFFTALLAITMFTYFGVMGSFATGILTTLQREFKFKSSQVGFLFTINDIVGLAVVTPVAYLGAPRNRPRILGCLTIVFALGCFLSSLPHFIGNNPEETVPDVRNGTTNSSMTGNSPQNVICVVNDDTMGSFSSDNEDDVEACSAEEIAASGAQYTRAIWLIIGQALCGIGSCGYFPLGITYIDDGVSKTSASVYIASLFMMGSLAPVFAFSISALVLSYHTDFHKIDVDDLGYGDKDPRWIGAWWLGYLIYTGIFIVLSIPYFFFPKVWPHKEKEVELEGMNVTTKRQNPTSPSLYMIRNMTSSSEGGSLKELIKGYLMAMTRLLTNVTFLACLMGVVTELSTMAGLFSFIGRYLQTQYDVSPSVTSIILGCIVSPTAFFGNFFGGVIVKKLKLSMKGLASMSLAICVTVFLITPLFFAVGCGNASIAGVNVPYPDYSSENGVDGPPSSCMADCECPGGVYTPVCGADGLTYVTPCHAGCTEYEEGTKYDGSGPKTSYVYSDCSCVASNSTTTDPTDNYGPFTAIQEACPRDCNATLIGFIIIFGVSMFINSLVKNPSFMLKLRCVEEEDRAVSMGTSSLVIRVLAFVPAPVYFGAAIQTTCVLFQESCGKTGNCLIYDTDRLRNVLFGLVLVLKLGSIVAKAVSYISIRRDKSGEYQSTKLCQKKKDQVDDV